MQLQEQLTIFDVFSGFGNVVLLKNPTKELKEEVLSEVDAYLQKGVTLSTLAKEEFDKKMSSFQFVGLDERVFSFLFHEKDTYSTIISKFAKSIFRPMLMSIVNPEDEYCRQIKELFSAYHLEVFFADGKEKNVTTRTIVNFPETGEVLLKMVYQVDGTTFEVYGLKNNAHSASTKNIVLKRGVVICDLALLLAALYFMEQINVAISKDTTYLKRYEFQYPSISAEEFIPEYMKKQFPEGLADPAAKDWYVHMKSSERVAILEYAVEYSMDLFGVRIHAIELPKHIEYLSKLEHTQYLQEKGEIRKDVAPIYFDRNELWGLCLKNLVAMIKHGFRFSYLDLLHETPDRKNYWALPLIDKKRYYTAQQKHANCIKNLFLSMYQVNRQRFRSLKQYEDLKSSYATSYVTKAGIPKATIAQMQKSLFNEYFSYVEFDEKVDLESITEIEKEFTAFKETFFAFINASKNALRFRRLGKHKAAGLYYPHVRCLCVDIRSPGAFVHEFGHLIDYSYGILSDLSDESFHSLYLEYTKLITQEVQKDKDEYARWSGTTKYNKDYYLNPSEVFARTFEIYVTSVLEISNNLVTKPRGCYYPLNEVFVQEVESYFENVFETIKGGICYEDK